LANFGVLAAAISDGAARLSWDPETFAFAEAHDSAMGAYQGLVAGSHVAVGLSQSAVLVRPEKARALLEQGGAKAVEPSEPVEDEQEDRKPSLPTRFVGRKRLDPVRAIRDFSYLIDEVVNHLQGGSSSEVTITVDIEATSDGFDDRTRRTVSENARQLGFEFDDFEG
jgi:hypothetical protein